MHTEQRLKTGVRKFEEQKIPSWLLIYNVISLLFRKKKI